MPQITPLTLNQQSSASTADVFRLVRTGVTPALRATQQCSDADSYGNSPAADHLYIHVPFCFHKCHYCDFYSFVDNRDRQAPFTDALLKQLERQSEFAAPLRTIFVGGGTPSLLAVELWSKLLSALDRYLDLSALQEFTVECNPETVTPELMQQFAEGVGSARVNRVSIGAQTFDREHLKALERWHEPDNVERAVDLAHRAGIPHRSVDLIYAIPGQTLDDVCADLDIATRMSVDHISAYALTYEPKTALTKRMELGHFQPTPDDLEADMFDLVHSKLHDTGYARYEVSNFAASDDARSKHNLAYWKQRDWLALGPSASGHLAGVRWKNVPRLTDWMDAVSSMNGECPVHDLESQDEQRALAELLMTGLRLTDGLHASDVFGAADALGVRSALEEALLPHIERGHLELTQTVLRCTEVGLRHADGIAADAIAALI